ncbi:MAG: tetratricopeptide repeat protein [Bryobacteraceae bacterium]|nr:tetratricopeptide repeat protein [Bryobacteraceae bacterium]
MSGSGTLEIRLFGSFRVLVDGRPVDDGAWGRRKSKTLLKLLALAPNRELHREQLAELMWPEAEPGVAQNNLHKTIHAARRALQPDLKDGRGSLYLSNVEERLALTAPSAVWIDATEFERLGAAALSGSDSAALDPALELYTGVLLPEDRFEDWATGPRERLSRLFQELLARAAARQEAAGEFSRAIELWQRAIAADRCNEVAHRALMRLFAATSNRHLALAQFRQCQDALRAELDAVPETATRQLYEEIASGGGTPASSSQPDKVPLPPAAIAAVPSRRGYWLAAGVLTIALASAAWFQLAPRQQAIRSIAVLPFDSTSALEYLSDGLTESVINNLSGLPGVRVMARSTVFQYKGNTGDPREMGRALRVDGVVTGSVRQRGTAVAVTAELVDVRDGARIWGRQFELDDSSLSMAQARVSSELAAALGARPEASQAARFGQPQTANAEAYRNYLLGRYHFSQRTREGFLRAEKYLLQAAAQDPAFAAAYTGLADVYGLLGFRHAPPREYFPKAAAMVRKALDLDPQSADAYTSLGMIKALYDWEWPEAQAAFRRALELNPGHATARHWYGVHLNSLKRWDDATAELTLALELDPLSRIIQTNAAYPVHFRRRFDEAARRYRKVFELDPDFVVAHEDLMMVHHLTGRYEESLEEALRMLRASGEKEILAAVEGAREKSPAGRPAYRAALGAWTEILLKRSRSSFVPPIQVAQLYLRMDDRDNALTWLERSLAEKSVPIVYIGADPQYDSLRGHPRFQALMAKLRLP